MTRQEFEERRRRLDEELRTGIELLEASHRVRVRALEHLWREEEEGKDGAVSPREAVPAAKLRRPAWQLHNAVVRALEHLPEVFSKDELCRVLGETPDRRALFRVMQDLIVEKRLEIAKRGSGRFSTSYRQLRRPAGV